MPSAIWEPWAAPFSCGFDLYRNQFTWLGVPAPICLVESRHMCTRLEPRVHNSFWA